MHEDVSFIYVGSRRQLLMDMLSKNRPFYGSCVFLTLDKITSTDFVPYIVRKFSDTGKTCSSAMASAIYDHAGAYPIYVQQLAGFVWNMTEATCSSETIDAAWHVLLHSETPFFQATWMELSPLRRRALNSIAIEPTTQPLAQKYLQSHDLSAPSMRKGLETLKVLDLVEYEQNWHPVDPVMAAWIRDTGTHTI